MQEQSPSVRELIERYAHGPQVLRAEVASFPADQLHRPLPPGTWSVQQVVSHLADFELVYADRIKAVLAEDGPQIPGRNDQRYAARLRYELRDLQEELALIDAVRRQMLPLLWSLSPEDLRRVGIHTTDGPLTVETLLKRIAGHIPHHVDFIERKRQLLLKPA